MKKRQINQISDDVRVHPLSFIIVVHHIYPLEAQISLNLITSTYIYRSSYISSYLHTYLTRVCYRMQIERRFRTELYYSSIQADAS